MTQKGGQAKDSGASMFFNRVHEQNAGLVGAVPADGEPMGQEIVAAEGLLMQGAVVAGGIREQFHDAIALRGG